MSLKRKLSLYFVVILALFFIPTSLVVIDNIKLKRESGQVLTFHEMNMHLSQAHEFALKGNSPQALKMIRLAEKDHALLKASPGPVADFFSKSRDLFQDKVSEEALASWVEQKNRFLAKTFVAKRSIEKSTKTYLELTRPVGNLMEHMTGVSPNPKVIKRYLKKISHAGKSGHYPANIEEKIGHFTETFDSLDAAQAKKELMNLRTSLDMHLVQSLENYRGVVNRYLSIIGSVVFGILFVFALIYYSFQKNILAPMENVVRALIETSDDIGQVSHDLTDTSCGLKTLSEDQRGVVDGAYISLTDISAAARQTEQKTIESSHSSATSRNLAVDGQQKVAQMGESMQNFRDQSVIFMDRTKGLLADIQNVIDLITEVGEKTDMINDIVLQTKMLSFNASVEASRAGEAGSGFAVVAAEIGNLAAISGQSAQDIHEILESRTAKVTQIVEQAKQDISEILDQGEQITKSGLELATGCQTSLGDIVEGAEENLANIQEIQEASETQGHSLSTVSQAMESVTQNSQQTETMAKQVDSLAVSLESKRGELGRISEELNRMFYAKSA